MNTIIIYIIYTILYIANILISTKLNFKQPYKKPTFQPPNFIFPIVWSILYTLLFFSIQHLDSNITKIFFIIQMIINVSWSTIFNNQYYINSLILILLLLFLNIFILLKDRIFLLLPYIIWLSFACILNIYYLLQKYKN